MSTENRTDINEYWQSTIEPVILEYNISLKDLNALRDAFYVCAASMRALDSKLLDDADPKRKKINNAALDIWIRGIWWFIGYE